VALGQSNIVEVGPLLETALFLCLVTVVAKTIELTIN